MDSCEAEVFQICLEDSRGVWRALQLVAGRTSCCPTGTIEFAMSTGVYYLFYFGRSSLEIMENSMQYIGYVDANSYCSFIWNCWGVSQGSFKGTFCVFWFSECYCVEQRFNCLLLSDMVYCCCSYFGKGKKKWWKSRWFHSEIGSASASFVGLNSICLH